MGHEDDVIGFIKYSGSRVQDGVIDARSAGDALLGLDGALRFFNEKQSRDFLDLEYEIPVQTKAGSWKAVLLIPLLVFASSYLKKAGEKMAETDFENVGTADVFRKSLSAVQYLIKLVKHTGQSSGWDLSKVKWRNGNKEAGVINDEGEVLYIPTEFFKWYTSTPLGLVRRITASVKSERILTIGVWNGNVLDEVSVNEAEKVLFDNSVPSEDGVDADTDTVLPELEHGQPVTLEGNLTRGNVSANSMGLEYQGHMLNCIPRTGSVKQFKSALFLRCIVQGTITRLGKHQNVLEKRPTVIVEKVTPLEHERQHQLL